MRRVWLLLVDGVLIALASIFGLLLRDTFEVSWAHLVALMPYVALTLTAAAAAFPLFGISRTRWRFAVMRDHLRLLGAIALSVIAAVTPGFVYNRLEDVARAVPVLQALLMLVFLVGALSSCACVTWRAPSPRSWQCRSTAPVWARALSWSG